MHGASCHFLFRKAAFISFASDGRRGPKTSPAISFNFTLGSSLRKDKSERTGPTALTRHSPRCSDKSCQCSFASVRGHLVPGGGDARISKAALSGGWVEEAGRQEVIVKTGDFGDKWPSEGP